MEIVKNRYKKLINKLKVKKKNYGETLDQIRCNIKVEADTIAKF